MLSVEIIDYMRQQERKREEMERPALRLPLESPPQEYPEETAAPAVQPETVVVINLNRDDVEEFRVSTW